MDVFLEKCRKFFTDVFEKIGMFFKKIVKKLNDFRIFLCSEIKKFFEKIKLKKEEFLKNRAIKRDEKKAAKQAKKEEKLKTKQEKEQRRQEEAAQRDIYLKNASLRIFRGFLNIFDVIFEVVFACGLIFCLRPELLDFRNENSYFGQIDFYSLKLILFGNFLPESTESSNFIIFICLAFVAYIAVLCIFDGAFRNFSILLLKEMILPIKWF